jgi:3-oxoacyl-[acyl-carrier-protein] synthase II
MTAGGLDPGAPPSEAAAFVVLETASAARRRGASILGTIAGYALGFEAGAALVAGALADADVAPADVARCVLASSAAAALISAGEGCTALAASFGETFGAAGPLGLLAGLAAASPGSALLVVDACASGHAAALVARAGAAA